jgi:flagellar motor protein MotB
MKKDGLTGTTRFVGRGTARPLVSNASKKLRAANRRVVITWSF